MRGQFEPNNGDDQGGDEKQTPKICRLVKQKYPDQNGASGTYARPNGIGGANGQALRGLNQQHHANG